MGLFDKNGDYKKNAGVLAGDRNYAMDGVRGLAVLIVFMSHTSGRGQPLSSFLQFQGIGHIGVYLFFVLSGYLLADNLCREWYRYGSISVRNFLIRRFFRIAPLYYFVLSAVFAFQNLSGKHYPKYLYIDGGVAGYIKHLLFWQGDGIFWTMPAEFIFYLLLPFIVIFILRYGNKARNVVALFAVFYFVWFFSIQVLHILPASLAMRLVDIRHNGQFLDVFLCGVLASFVSHSEFFKAQVEKNSKKMDAIAVLVLVVTMTATLTMVSYKFFGFDRPFYTLRWFSLFYGLAFGYVIVATNLNGITQQFFEFRILRFLGIVGFSWYLTHMAVFQMVNELHFAPYILFFLSSLGCAVLSTCLFLAIERPFMALGKKITVTRKNFSSTTKMEKV